MANNNNTGVTASANWTKVKNGRAGRRSFWIQNITATAELMHVATGTDATGPTGDSILLASAVAAGGAGKRTEIDLGPTEDAVWVKRAATNNVNWAYLDL